LKLSSVSLGMLSGWWICPQGEWSLNSCVEFMFVMTTSFLGGFFCCVVLSLLYTFMVSLLCVRNLYIFWQFYWSYFALFSYPYMRSSCVFFGIVQLFMCEEVVCAFGYALFCNDNQHMFCIQQVTMIIGLASSWWIIVHHWSVYDGIVWFIYPCWYECVSSNWSYCLSCL